jgi:hypothetical protein
VKSGFLREGLDDVLGKRAEQIEMDLQETDDAVGLQPANTSCATKVIALLHTSSSSGVRMHVKRFASLCAIPHRRTTSSVSVIYSVVNRWLLNAARPQAVSAN